MREGCPSNSGRLDDVPFEQRRDILKLLLEQVVIDRDSNIRSTLGIPTEERVGSGRGRNPTLRTSSPVQHSIDGRL